MIAPFFDGMLSRSASDAAVDVINPSNGQPLLSLPMGCAADVDRAVASARRAFQTGGWSEASPSFRKQCLQRLADLVAANAPTLDELDAGEMGKPVSEALFNGVAAAAVVRFYAEAVDKVTGDVYTSDKLSLVLQRAVARGVVAAVVPWNFPTYNAALKVAPALAAGNCVVLKPSEHSSRSALLLAQLAMEAGLPPGVLNMVPGVGEIVGSTLGQHSNVDMVAFTGSTQVGKRMLEYSARSNMKAVLAECGGKSPQIVFADGVDVAAAGQTIARTLLTNQGQICSVGSRVLVQRSIEEALLATITAQMRQVVIGDALHRATTFGPLVSEMQCERVMQYVESAKLDGAELVLGGKRVLESSGGYFVEPTIFANVRPSSRIAQEEIFGPILSVIPFDDEADAIAIANGTPFELAAYVWTADLSRGMRMAKAIRSTVFINSAAPLGEGAGHAASFEPGGLSGLGTEGGVAGMESYLRRQLVWINYA